jgi:hypothetical protein
VGPFEKEDASAKHARSGAVMECTAEDPGQNRFPPPCSEGWEEGLERPRRHKRTLKAGPVNALPDLSTPSGAMARRRLEPAPAPI